MAKLLFLDSASFIKNEKINNPMRISNIVEDLDLGITTVASDFSNASKEEINEYFKLKFKLYNFYLNIAGTSHRSLLNLNFHLNEVMKLRNK